jgi:uncharacterized protein (DUF697 family)
MSEEKEPATPSAEESAKTPEDPHVMAEKMLSAVERITTKPEEIVALVDNLRATTGSEKRLVDKIISHYSNRCAITGGATALPGLIPGIGTVAYLLTGPLADMVLLLKYEVEMTCALASAHGFDITLPEERQLALLLAAVKTSEVSSGKNVLREIGEVSWTAIWNYAPRRVSKAIIEVMAIIALQLLLKRMLLKMIPFIGMAVGAGMNKVLTQRVGNQAEAEISLRKKLLAESAARSSTS